MQFREIIAVYCKNHKKHIHRKHTAWVQRKFLLSHIINTVIMQRRARNIDKFTLFQSLCLYVRLKGWTYLIHIRHLGVCHTPVPGEYEYRGSRNMSPTKAK